MEKPFAQAAGAPAPTTIVTDAAGLVAGMAALPGGVPVYAAKPAGVADAPVVLVAQEIFGLHEHIRDICRRFARLGCFAVAPDYFFRYGDPMRAPDIDAIRAIVAKAPDVETMEIFDAALAFARRSGGDPNHAAITGFCWGGRIAWLYAAHRPDLNACLPWYGRLDGPHTPPQPRWPLDLTSAVKVPTLGFYGGADPSIPREQIEAMRAKLAAAEAPAEILVYDDAPHAFFADYRDSYRAAAARDAWGRAVAFLRAQGVG